MDEAVKTFIEMLEVMWSGVQNYSDVPKTVLEYREVYNKTTELYGNPMAPGGTDTSSPETYNYLWWRWAKSTSTTGIKWVGLGAGMVTGVAAWWGAASLAYGAGMVALGSGATGLFRSGQSLALSGIHGQKLGKLAAKAPSLSEIQVLLSGCLAAKVYKGVKSTGEIMTFCFPEATFINMLGSLLGLEMAGKVITFLGGKGIEMSLGMVLDYVAGRIHALAKGGDSAALEIVEEIFTRRGLGGFLFGVYDWRKIVAEPAGWMAIADKLKLGAVGG